MHSSSHLNEANTLLYLHQVSLKILAYNLTSLNVNVVVLDLLGLESVSVVVVAVAVDFVAVGFAIGFVVIVVIGWAQAHPHLYLPSLFN